MVRKKTGWPEEGELVIATVTKIQYHSVFCTLDEYDKSGMIHISEIAPGRVKNIAEYVKEGKTIVAKVLRLDQERGHIDLSLRRVTEAQRRNKAAQLKQQQVVEKILVSVGEQLSRSPEALLVELERATQEFTSVFDAFHAIVEEQLDVQTLGFDEKLATTLEKAVRDRIAPTEIAIQGVFTIVSWAPDGVERVRSIFADLPVGVEVVYAGGGRYTTTVRGKEFKAAEETLKALIQRVQGGLSEAQVAFARTDRR